MYDAGHNASTKIGGAYALGNSSHSICNLEDIASTRVSDGTILLTIGGWRWHRSKCMSMIAP